jgi:hypothetical protein
MAKRLCRQELYDLVWSTPMRTLAAQFEISDVGLKKACARAAIPTPDRGYWAKKDAGKETFQVALPKRPLGMSDEIVLARGSNYWYYDSTEQELLGPLPAPPEFPEPIDAVRERIAQAVGAVAVPHRVNSWHPAIDHLLKEDERRREQQRLAVYRTSWDQPLFDSPRERRRLRILNSLFFAVAKMNGKPTISLHEPPSIQVSFYQQHVGITLDQPAQPRRGHVAAKQPGAKDDPRLSLSILRGLGSGETRTTWQDDDGSKLEARMQEIAVELILTAELQYRESAIRHYEWRVKRRAELEEKERQRKIEAERAERARQRRIEQARTDRLLKDAAAFQQAKEIRKYVEALRSMRASNELSSPEEFDQWSAWALTQADRIDPAISGKFVTAMQDEDDT